MDILFCFPGRAIFIQYGVDRPNTLRVKYDVAKIVTSPLSHTHDL